MLAKPPVDESTAFLVSPPRERERRLQPMRELTVRPYSGNRRRVKLFRTRVTLGRDARCDWSLDDPFVSPVHAELRLGGAGYEVHDLGSRNGVFLNGVRVSCAPLPSQGTLRIGRSTLVWGDAAPSTSELGEGWVAEDPAMRAMLGELRTAAASGLPVLLLGETGTGKDGLARLLHSWSARAGGAFVPVNGALTGGSLAESELFGHQRGAFTGAENTRLGALRAAHGGTLFLDEVADVPGASQAKLLRALETGEVKALGADEAERTDFRLVTATSRNLEGRVAEGTFRADLFFRIAGFVLRVPPLRERPRDVKAIARALLAAKGLELADEAEARLLSYRWPGNVRELRASVERAAAVARGRGAYLLLADDFGGLGEAVAPSTAGEPPVTLREHERRLLLRALERNGWSRVAAARELGIARSSLLGKMKRFRLWDGRLLAATESRGSG